MARRSGLTLLLAGMQGAGPAHAAHHFVEDQQNSVAVAYLADALEIAGYCGNRAQGGADHWFGYEGDDVLAPNSTILPSSSCASRLP